MLKRHLIALAALSSLGFLPMAQAADKVVDDRFYVAPFGTFIQPGGDRQSDNGWGGGMGFGKMLNEHFNVEFKGFYQKLHGGKYGGSDMTGGSAEVQYYIMRNTFSPYTVVGLGGMNTTHHSDSAAGMIGEVGAGFTYEVSDNFLLRSDVRYRLASDFRSSPNQDSHPNQQPGTGTFNDMLVNVGFVIPLGAKPKAPEPVAAQVPEPTPVAVAADCSTMDDDQDGVNNCIDECPTTLPGVQVSIKGCWIVDVKFDNDKAVIRPEYFGNLDNTAKAIKEHPELRIEIQGHTSKTGGFKHNMLLSERRAIAVKKYLVDGTDSPNLTIRGYGWTQPIDTNDTEAGRANNRRVQLEVDGQRQQPLNPQ